MLITTFTFLTRLRWITLHRYWVELQRQAVKSRFLRSTMILLRHDPTAAALSATATLYCVASLDLAWKSWKNQRSAQHRYGSIQKHSPSTKRLQQLSV